MLLLIYINRLNILWKWDKHSSISAQQKQHIFSSLVFILSFYFCSFLLHPITTTTVTITAATEIPNNQTHIENDLKSNLLIVDKRLCQRLLNHRNGNIKSVIFQKREKNEVILKLYKKLSTIIGKFYYENVLRVSFMINTFEMNLKPYIIVSAFITKNVNIIIT